MAATVCIVNQSSTCVTEARLTAEQLKVRRSANCVPDLIFSGSGTTAAFLLLRSLADASAKLDKMKAFMHSYVLVPHVFLSDAAAIAQISRLSTEEVSFVYMPAGADFTAAAFSVSKAVFLAAAHARQWRSKQVQVLQASDTINGVLEGLPLPPEDVDSAHLANRLRMLGSLRQISQLTPQQICQHTSLDLDSSLEIAAFFRQA